MPPKKLWPVEARTPQRPWRCPVVSAGQALAADPLCSTRCEVGPPWITLVCPEYPTDARWDWYLGTLEAKSTARFHVSGALSCWKWPPPSGNAVAMRQYSWSATILKHVKVASTWSPGPKVSQQTIAQNITLSSASLPSSQSASWRRLFPWYMTHTHAAVHMM